MSNFDASFSDCLCFAFGSDFSSGVRALTVSASVRYQKTAESLKGVGEKTSSLFGSLGITAKLGEMKNSTAFKSFEERVGSAVGTVKVTCDAASTPSLTQNLPH